MNFSVEKELHFTWLIYNIIFTMTILDDCGIQMFCFWWASARLIASRDSFWSTKGLLLGRYTMFFITRLVFPLTVLCHLPLVLRFLRELLNQSTFRQWVRLVVLSGVRNHRTGGSFCRDRHEETWWRDDISYKRLARMMISWTQPQKSRVPTRLFA